MKIEKTTKKKERNRHFACVLYPESHEVDFIEKIEKSHLEAFLSPLHADEDDDPKPHYHLLVSFPGTKSKEQATEFFKSLGGVGCEVIQNHLGYARYLCHLDNADKKKYSVEDVVSFGGANYQKILARTADRHEVISEIISHIRAHKLVHYADLVDYAHAERFDWFVILCDSTGGIIKEYMRSVQYKSNFVTSERNAGGGVE